MEYPKSILIKERKRINEIIGKLSKKKYVNAVFLFGSHAEKRANARSDIDIAVMTNNASKDQDFDIFGFGDEGIEVHPFSRLPLVIQFRIIKNGILLYARDKKVLIDTERAVIRDYLDFAPFIERFCRRVIANV